MGCNAIFTCDLSIFFCFSANNAYSKITDIYRTNVQIQSRGRMTWTSTIEWNANCEVDITWFPVDKQVGIFNFKFNKLSSFIIVKFIFEIPFIFFIA